MTHAAAINLLKDATSHMQRDLDHGGGEIPALEQAVSNAQSRLDERRRQLLDKQIEINELKETLKFLESIK
jgi:hypothetical protein